MAKGQFENDNQAAKKHGLYTLRDRGPAALEELERASYAELRKLFATSSGRDAIRLELATRLYTMIGIGFTELEKIADNGDSIWDAPPTRRMGTYINSLQRLLDGWPADDQPKDVTSILEGSSGE